MNKNFAIKQIMPIESGWYLKLDNGLDKKGNQCYTYDRVIGLYLVEIQWPNGNKCQEVIPMTRWLVNIDMTQLEIWRDTRDKDGYDLTDEMSYFPNEELENFER